MTGGGVVADRSGLKGLAVTASVLWLFAVGGFWIWMELSIEVPDSVERMHVVFYPAKMILSLIGACFIMAGPINYLWRCIGKGDS